MPPAGLLRFAALLTAIACLPLWWFPHLTMPDAAAHLYSAALMRQLIDGDALASARVMFTTAAMPNSSGHWLLAALVALLDATTLTRLMLTLSYAGFVLAAGWLRASVRGGDARLAMLFAAAVGFNWLWLSAMFNFTIGLATMIAATAAMHRWRDDLRAGRGAALAALVLVVYFSHAIAFAVMAVVLAALAITAAPAKRRRAVAMSAAALVPAGVLAVIYVAAGSGSGDLAPHWRSLEATPSVRGVIAQLASFDPFIFISRSALPFTTARSTMFAIAAPGLWIGAAVAAAAIATMKARRADRAATAPFGVLAGGLLLVAIVGPTDFGYSTGAVFRERVLLAACGLGVTLFTFAHRRWSRIATTALAIAFAFQWLCLWEFAARSSAAGAAAAAIRPLVGGDAAVASIVVLESGEKMHNPPEPQANAVNGIGRRGIVWDNYELGHVLFPITARDPAERAFYRDWSIVSVVTRGLPADAGDAQLDRLTDVLARNHARIDTLIVWNRDARLEAALASWFTPADRDGAETSPLRLWQHRPR